MCVFDHSDCWNHLRHVASCLASLYHLHSSSSSLRVLPGKRENKSNFLTMIQQILLTFFFLYFLQRYYTPTARELSRMSGVERAPILHHFAESLAGATTIRAFDQRDRFISSNLILIDNHSRPWFHVASAMEWLSFRLNLLSHFVFAFSLVLLVTLPEGVINPSKSHTS